jgi:thiol-disulfide isomerase/thioredoxin
LIVNHGVKKHSSVMFEIDGSFIKVCRHFFVCIVLFWCYAGNSVAELADIPHVAEKAQHSFQYDYLYAAPHRAFAIAPGGAWSWAAGKSTKENASQSALDACARYTSQKCVLYAVDNQIVFDVNKWAGLWGPYINKRQLQKTETGVGLGKKFPDLKFTDPKGGNKTISSLKGKVVFVHFWGCWCPSCRYEFVTLIDMYRIINDIMPGQVEFVVLQVREPIAQARSWAKENNVSALPLSDSGVQSASDTKLSLKGGGTIEDRELATVFPASYVLDKHGVVVFSHMGSIDDWSQYVAFFRDVAKRSGQ